jgi:hypothetical protein
MRKPTDLVSWPGSVSTGYLYSIHGFGSESNAEIPDPDQPPDRGYGARRERSFSRRVLTLDAVLEVLEGQHGETRKPTGQHRIRAYLR